MSKVRGKLSYKQGFSLIEMLVALFLSTMLILGFSTAYSSVTGLVQTSKNLENAQEVLRYSAEVFARSLKQTETDPTYTLTTLSVDQLADRIACNGTIPTDDFTETFSIDASNLVCKIENNLGVISEEIILTGVDSLNFSQVEQIVSVVIQPQALGVETAISPVTLDVALTTIILQHAM